MFACSCLHAMNRIADFNKKSGLKSNFDYSFKICLSFFILRGYNELKMYIKLNNFVCFASHSIDFIESIYVDLKFLKIQPEKNQLHARKWLRLVKKREKISLSIFYRFFPFNLRFILHLCFYFNFLAGNTGMRCNVSLLCGCECKSKWAFWGSSWNRMWSRKPKWSMLLIHELHSIGNFKN